MLISNIAHDLKTPITAVKGYAEGLMDGVADTPEKRDKYIRTIYNKANEMDTLINELTLYAKIDTNRIPYNFAKINVGEYFNDCIEEIGLDLESKNIGLAYFNYTDGSTQIIADPEQLRRVIHNIIGNSINIWTSREDLSTSSSRMWVILSRWRSRITAEELQRRICHTFLSFLPGGRFEKFRNRWQWNRIVNCEKNYRRPRW